MSKKYIIKNGLAVEVSDEIFEFLKKSDRRIKYIEHDLKETRYIIDQKRQLSRRYRAARTRSID